MEIYFGQIEEAYSRLAREQALLDLKTLTQETEALVKSTASDLSAEAQEIRARVIATLEHAKATCIEIQRQGAETRKAVVKRADTVIREHPYQSIVIAFGLGVLAGVLASWRRGGAWEAVIDQD